MVSMEDIIIDIDACAACGTCEAYCPETFKLEGEYAMVIGEPEGCDLQQVIDDCPTEAIIVKGLTGGGRKQV